MAVAPSGGPWPCWVTAASRRRRLGAANAGQWSPLTSLSALAATAPGRGCGLVAVNAVPFGPDNVPMAAGSCARRGVAGVSLRPAVLAGGRAGAARGFGGDQVQVLGLAAACQHRGGNAALLPAGTDLLAAWSGGGRWTVSGRGAVGGGGRAASGFGPGGSVWVLLGGGRAETISGPGSAWRALPALPAGVATLRRSPGPGRLTRWRVGVAAHRLAAGRDGLGQGAGDQRADLVRLIGLGQRENRAMNYITQHWSFDPFLILAVWSRGGRDRVRRLARRSRPERTRERRLRSLWFYAGLAVLLIAVYLADHYGPTTTSSCTWSSTCCSCSPRRR